PGIRREPRLAPLVRLDDHHESHVGVSFRSLPSWTRHPTPGGFDRPRDLFSKSREYRGFQPAARARSSGSDGAALALAAVRWPRLASSAGASVSAVSRHAPPPSVPAAPNDRTPPAADRSSEPYPTIVV